jgi:hypothetical protein
MDRGHGRRRETFVVAGMAFKNGKFDGVYLGRRRRACAWGVDVLA